MIFPALVTQSIGGVSSMGTPPTPIPMLAWTGMLEFLTQSLTMTAARATFQAKLLEVFQLTTAPKMLAPAFSQSFTCSFG